MIEADDPDQLPPYTVLVRRGPRHGGRAVAAYSNPRDAAEHAGPLEDASVWWDRGTALRRDKPHRITAVQRERDRVAVEALIARWLAGDWWTPGGPVVHELPDMPPAGAIKLSLS